MDFDSLNFDFNHLIMHPQFEETVREVRQLDVLLPDISSQGYALEDYVIGSESCVASLGPMLTVKLNPASGQALVNDSRLITAYDESILKFQSLEGVAYFTSHSLVVLGEEGYMPINYLTFYFYTKSIEIVKRSKYIKQSSDPGMDSQKDYIKDRILFLEKTIPPRSILFIDGPLIAGDVYTYLIKSIDQFHEKDIIPIFFVKNSSSNLLTDNISELKGKYNSDMHWSYLFLKEGHRTNFYSYCDNVNPRNAKCFCYLKGFDVSPQRVEMHLDTYKRYEHLVPGIMEMVYYLLLVQGNKNNPQIRPIAISEKYARETLKLLNINKIIKEVGITPTMNQIRFGS